jgi:hypothetical protein
MRVALLCLLACAAPKPPVLQNRRIPTTPEPMTDGPTVRACTSPIAMIEITISDGVGIAHDFCTSIAASLELRGRSLVPKHTLLLALALEEIVKDGELDLTCRLAAVISTTSDRVIARIGDTAKLRASSPSDVERATHECIDRAIDKLFDHVVPAIAQHRSP